MKKILSLIKNLFLALLLVIVAIELYFTASKLIAPNSYATLFGYSKAVVLSDSMKPKFVEGDLLIYKSQNSYGEGDIVVFCAPGQTPVTHRIVGMTEDGKFITRGDANNTDDTEPLSPEHIHGKLVLIVPNGGDVAEFISSPLGIIVLMVLLVTLFELPSLIAKFAGEDGEEGEKDEEDE